MLLSLPSFLSFSSSHSRPNQPRCSCSARVHWPCSTLVRPRVPWTDDAGKSLCLADNYHPDGITIERPTHFLLAHHQRMGNFIPPQSSDFIHSSLMFQAISLYLNR
jgi:hypothetical protein